MGLTRPTAAQINSDIEVITDPISLLNNKSNRANVDVGLLFNRDGGISSNVAVFWQESNQRFVFALTTSNGVSRFSNIAVTSNANVVAGNVFAAGYFYSNGAAFSGGSSYSNVQVATYLPTYTGVVTASNVAVNGNVTAQYILGSGQFLTGLPAGYSNVNVKAYTESMGFQNYGNVNVAALITTNGLTNYSNVNAKAYTETMGFQNYSNVNVIAYLGGNITVGNIIVPTGAGQFNGPFNESTTVQGVYIGNLNLSPRIGFFNGTAAQNWQIDNNFGTFRWYTPGVTRMTIDTGGNLNVPSGNIMTAGNVTAPYFIGSGQFLTGLPAGYSNVNVKAYTESMGFTNFSNVNVAAYTQTIGYTNYSNVNVVAYTQTQSFTNYSNVNLAAYLGGAVTVGGNLTVNGNLFVNGNVTVFNTNNLSINDSMIYLADDNPADLLDIGFVSAFTNPGYQHTGFVRDASDGVWKLFANVIPEPTTTVDFTNANYSSLYVGNIQTAASANIGSTLNVVGNVLGSIGTFGALTVGGFINTIGNVSTAALTAGQINTTGNVVATVFSGGAVNVSGNVLAAGSIFNLLRVNHQLGGSNSSSFNDSVTTATSSNQTLKVNGGNQYVFFNANLGAGNYNSLTSGNDIGIIFSGFAGQGSGNLVIAPWNVSQAGIRIVGTTGLVQIPGQLTINANNSPTAIASGGTAGVGNIGVSGAPFNTAFLTTLNATGNILATTGVFNNVIVNTGNINAVGGYFVGSGQFLTGLPAGYSNVNVKAYTESMGFTNFSNVNVAAYLGGAVTIGGNLTVQSNLNVTGNVYSNGGTDPLGYVYSIDDISSQFDGSQVVFTISVNDGTIYSVNNPNQISLQIGGVSVAPTRYIRDYFNLSGVSVFNRGFYLQTGNIEANASIITGNNFSTGGNTIVFATAPSAGMSFYGTVRTNSDPIAQFTFKQSPFTALNIMLGS